ncbi:MAG: cytochrome c [Pyrinomonadaceae bacterium]
MKFLKVFIVIVFAGFFTAACISSASGTKGIVIAEDKSYEASLFRQNCAVCHGKEAEGREMEGKIIPSLRRGDVEKKSEAEIYNQIYNGGNGMVPFKGQLSENEIERMVKFVKYGLQGK